MKELEHPYTPWCCNCEKEVLRETAESPRILWGLRCRSYAGIGAHLPLGREARAATGGGEVLRETAESPRRVDPGSPRVVTGWHDVGWCTREDSLDVTFMLDYAEAFVTFGCSASAKEDGEEVLREIAESPSDPLRSALQILWRNWSAPIPLAREARAARGIALVDNLTGQGRAQVPFQPPPPQPEVQRKKVDQGKHVML